MKNSIDTQKSSSRINVSLKVEHNNLGGNNPLRFDTIHYKILLAFLVLFAPFGGTLHAQVKIGDNPETINSSSLLELESTDKGILIPRLTATQRNAISSPADALLIYNTSTNKYNYYDESAWQVIESNGRDNHVLVKTVSDFPAALSGVITLDGNSVYEINGTIMIADKIDLNGAIVHGLGGFADQLVYTGSTELFTGSKGGAVRNLLIAASVAGSQVFNLSDVGKTETILIKTCIFYNCKKAGTIEGYSVVYMHSNGFSLCDDGFTFTNSDHVLLNNQNFLGDNKGTMIDLTNGSTFGFVEIVGGIFHVTAANSATGMDFGTGVTVTNGGGIRTNFHGDGTRITGTPSKEWDITSHGVDTQTDDVATGDLYITSSATTAIAAINTPIKVAGTTSAVNLFRVTASSNNRLTYGGTKTRAFKFSSTLSLTASGNNKTFNFYLAKNGVVLPESKQRRKIATGVDVGVVALSGIVSLAPGDYIEVWIENTTDNTDATIETMNLSIL